MLKNQNIICISSIDWDFLWQGHQEIMSTFAKNGNRVLFIENTGVRSPGIKDISRIKHRIKNWLKGVKGIRKEEEHLYIFSPIVLPFPYSRIATWFNRRFILFIINKWMKAVDFRDPIIWTFLPTTLAFDLLSNIYNKLTVYYCIADFERLVKNPIKIRKSERNIIEKSDIVFAQGLEIKKHCEKYNKNVSIFPFGVNVDNFNDYRYPNKRPNDIVCIKGKIIGYIGGVHKHIDFGLIRFLAENNPSWTFVFIGPIQDNALYFKKIENIIFLDMKEHKELPAYIKFFDVCIIPYILNEYTKTVYPTKLNEYLIMGKPVVSTKLPEITFFNEQYGDIVYIANDKEEFQDLISKAFEEKEISLKNRRIEIAKENNWENRIEKMSKIIEEAIEKKKENNESKWKENFLLFYKQAGRKFLKIALTCFFVYFLLFKTTAIWFLAEPLKIEQTPKQADAIVVFGGGVGETGNPGKSTIERARYATELYKKGYADKIIFSSGYTYRYNDAENMRLFAVSIGVSAKDIILEQKANSTYENVKFSKDIIERNKWDSILVVSSPYNMRRVSLVFNVYAKGLKVIYTPVKNPQFYDRTCGVKLQQISAIIHEYLGIVYYWFKGYI
ncbi:MAG: ElyC/SanA/YdcF family protein [Candidatus Omnitrophota bacterium]